MKLATLPYWKHCGRFGRPSLRLGRRSGRDQRTFIALGPVSVAHSSYSRFCTFFLDRTRSGSWTDIRIRGWHQVHARRLRAIRFHSRALPGPPSGSPPPGPHSPPGPSRQLLRRRPLHAPRAPVAGRPPSPAQEAERPPFPRLSRLPGAPGRTGGSA